jgi:hypothetical protein
MIHELALIGTRKLTDRAMSPPGPNAKSRPGPEFVGLVGEDGKLAADVPHGAFDPNQPFTALARRSFYAGRVTIRT